MAEAYAGVERAQKELGTHESIPIGAIPAGSGNAICVSLAEQSEEVNDATAMALLIAKGQTIRLDGARLAIYRNDENGSNAAAAAPPVHGAVQVVKKALSGTGTGDGCGKSPSVGAAVVGASEGGGVGESRGLRKWQLPDSWQ